MPSLAALSGRATALILRPGSLPPPPATRHACVPSAPAQGRRFPMPAWLRVVCLTIPLAALAAEPAAPAAAQPAIAPAAQAAALSGDWSDVLRTCPIPHDRPAGPSLLLRAHANLALNRGNDAAQAFAAASPDDLARWDAWSATLDVTDTGSPWARYLRADALARTRRIDEALALLEPTPATAPLHPLARNARGVLRAAKRDFAGAFDDFSAAANETPQLTVSRVHCAAVALDAHEGARAALADATRALDLEPDNALALYHRACLELILRDLTRAEADLARAGQVAPALVPWLDRASHVAYAGLVAESADGAGAPGFSLTAESSTVKSFAAGDFGWGGSKFKDAIKNTDNVHDLNLIVNAGKVWAGNDPAKQEKVASLWKQAGQEKASAGVLNSATKAWDLTVSGGAKSETKTHIDAGVGLPGGKGLGLGGLSGGLESKNGTRIDGGIGLHDKKEYTFPSLSAAQQKWDKAYSKVDDMLHQTAKINPGGFDAGQHSAVLDSGDWPFVPIYAFLYPAPSSPPPPQAPPKTP